MNPKNSADLGGILSCRRRISNSYGRISMKFSG